MTTFLWLANLTGLENPCLSVLPIESRFPLHHSTGAWGGFDDLRVDGIIPGGTRLSHFCKSLQTRAWIAKLRRWRETAVFFIERGHWIFPAGLLARSEYCVFVETCRKA